LKVTVERTPESEAVLNVQLEWDEVEKASERAYKRIAQKYNVPGFRRGHAPRSMLERMLGKDAIYQEGIEDLVEASYRDAIREHDLTPIAQPAVDAPPIEIGQPYTFTARVPILTPAKLGDYTSIRVPLPDSEVSDIDVMEALERRQEQAAIWLPAERAAQVGDQVIADLKLTVEDKVVSDLHDNEFELAIERPGIFAGLDDHLVGMREGESAEFTTTIPEDYANTALAGKEGHYEVTIKGVKYRELPELDDEFAKSQGEFESLDALRESVREQLERQKQSEAQRELRDAVVKTAVDQSEAQIHPALVDDEVDAMLRETSRVLAQNRLSLEYYLAMMQKSEEEYRKQLEPEATERVRRDLVLSAVADAEGIEVSDGELQNWLELMSMLGAKPTRLQQLSAGQRANIASRLRRDKALNRLVEIATEGQVSAEHTHDHDHDHTFGDQAASEQPAQLSASASPTDAEATSLASAQEAARQGAGLSGETSGTSASAGVETTQTGKSSESQALRGAGTEVPQ
jgi:trigger factor